MTMAEESKTTQALLRALLREMEKSLAQPKPAAGGEVFIPPPGYRTRVNVKEFERGQQEGESWWKDGGDEDAGPERRVGPRAQTVGGPPQLGRERQLSLLLAGEEDPLVQEPEGRGGGREEDEGRPGDAEAVAAGRPQLPAGLDSGRALLSTPLTYRLARSPASDAATCVHCPVGITAWPYTEVHAPVAPIPSDG